MKPSYSFLAEHAPCYCYDGAQISAQCRALQEALSGFGFLYSVKTNPFDPVVKAIAQEGFGADAASAREVMIARENGMLPSQIFYSSPGKTDADLRACWGACVFIADSLSEVARIQAIAHETGEIVGIGIRINPDFTMDDEAPIPSKFGIDFEQLPQFIAVLNQSPNVALIGVHVHVKSQVLSVETLAQYYQRCFALAQELSAGVGTPLQFINFGSGIGAVYDNATQSPVALTQLSELLSELRAENDASLRAALYIETGRFVVCNAGTYYTRVVDKKHSRGVEYVIVQNAMNGFMRPAITSLLSNNVKGTPRAGQEPLYTCEHAFAISVVSERTASSDAKQQTEVVEIVGNLCTSLDVLAQHYQLPEVQVGDVLAVSNAGSYAYSLSPLLFSSHATPKEFYFAPDGHVE